MPPIEGMRRHPTETREELERKILEQKEAEIDRLRDELRYKDQRLASKDLEMETFKKVTEERIFQLEARVKELEARRKERYPTHR